MDEVDDDELEENDNDNDNSKSQRSQEQLDLEQEKSQIDALSYGRSTADQGQNKQGANAIQKRLIKNSQLAVTDAERRSETPAIVDSNPIQDDSNRLGT